MKACEIVDSLYASFNLDHTLWFERAGTPATPAHMPSTPQVDFRCFELVAGDAGDTGLWASFAALADAKAAARGYRWYSVREYWWCGAFVLARLCEPVEGSGFTAVCRAETWRTTDDVRELAPLAL